MRKLSVLFIAVAMLMTTGLAKAQKIATMDVAGVLSAMPEKIKADKQLKAFAEAKEKALKVEGEKFQALYQKYTKEAPSKSEAVNKQREKEIQAKGQKFEQLKLKMQKEILAKEKSAYAPIERKFNAAVQKVADANGWEYVMDANSPALIYKNGVDATPAIKKALGIK